MKNGGMPASLQRYWQNRRIWIGFLFWIL